MFYQNEIIGGLLIGLAAALPLMYDGNISGVSGYASTCLQIKSSTEKRGFFFVVGLIFGGFIWLILDGELPSSDKIHLPIVIWFISGILVGFGSRLGGGCTSGHGVCGLGRASIRSSVSVVLFMAFAILTNFLMRLIP